MTDSRQAEPALLRRSSRTLPAVSGDSSASAPAAQPAAPALTRAELRRRAQREAAASVEAPLTRRRARTSRAESTSTAAPETSSPVALDGVVSIDALPDLDPAALASDVHRVASDDSRPAEADDALDPFEAAARLFSFTGETPVQVAAAAIAEQEETEAAEPRRRGASFRRVATASFSIGVVGVVGLLTVGMTTPPEAVAALQGNGTAAVSALAPAGDVESGEGDIQAYVAPAQVQNQAIERSEDYKTASLAQVAAESGISNFSNFFTNDPNAPIQWPFAVGVPITYGFGMRSGRMHEGLDLVPGAGSPVQAIADGTVRIATESGGAYGVTVVIDHEIDGQLVSSRYAHMQYGSLQVKVGQKVTVGTFIGRTGNTGRSFGAHTHFEILMNGTTPIDPLPWLREHAGG
ncbi:M23 family metallopeptidase [Microbacterium sp. 10M-3C3]|uniref:M23 family metallopeptidase n=1 Tax=Microbacterium sp. 10M-3C3 TaxID=2483401 RepID=UPI000F63A6C5|nr:M23 family metallopeptidase [Microbacterium sp. 10M-3C3]